MNILNMLLILLLIIITYNIKIINYLIVKVIYLFMKDN